MPAMIKAFSASILVIAKTANTSSVAVKSETKVSSESNVIEESWDFILSVAAAEAKEPSV